VTDPADNSPPEAAAPQAPRPDPKAFQLRGDPPRVMRLSRKALAAIGVVASLGIGGSLIYALKPAGEKEAKELYSTDSRATSETITSGPRDYSQARRFPVISAARSSRRNSAGRMSRSRRSAPSPIRAPRPRKPPASASARSATRRA